MNEKYNENLSLRADEIKESLTNSKSWNHGDMYHHIAAYVLSKEAEAVKDLYERNCHDFSLEQYCYNKGLISGEGIETLVTEKIVMGLTKDVERISILIIPD